MENEFLSKVYGYREIKKELQLIRDWYLNSNKDESIRKLLPKGILFYGNPGNGKSFLMKEYSETFNFPVFVINGDSDNYESEITKTYEEAKKEINSIVVIDELDKLISKDIKLTRVLMSCLDGFDKNYNILTLATCNDYDELPEAILREGRFDREFFVRPNKKEDLKSIIVGISKEVGINLNNDEIFELVDNFSHCSIAKIKSIFNNVKLRFGNKYKLDDIIKTMDYTMTGVLNYDDNSIVNRTLAIHEAGHAVYMYKCCKTKKFLRIIFTEKCGKTLCRGLESFDTKENMLENIRIGLSGLIAEELILKSHDIGCHGDLETIDDIAFKLVNQSLMNGIDYYCSYDKYYKREKLNSFLSKKYEIRSNKLIRQSYKVAKKELKKYKKEILLVSNYLLEHKGITRKEFVDLLSSCETNSNNKSSFVLLKKPELNTI